MVGTGLSGSLPALLLWRAVSGAGGSAQMTGAQLYLSDISTPLNRARTLAPSSAAFAAGASLGPAIGGVLVRYALPMMGGELKRATFLDRGVRAQWRID